MRPPFGIGVFIKMHSKLIQFATQRDLDYIEAIKKYGSNKKAAKALGVNSTTIDRSIVRLKNRAALTIPSEHDYTRDVPSGFNIKGVSQYIGKDGKIIGQWVKTSQDSKAQAEVLKAAIAAMCEEIPVLEATVSPLKTYGNLCNVYTLTDSHVGQLSWSKETLTGDWDLKIAEEVLVGCFKQMVDSSPAAETCVIAQLGDYLHYDSAISAVTPLHGHVLTADGRMPKMVNVAIRILRTVCALALRKHKKVILLLAEGNHDVSSSVWLRAMFQALYENEPRIVVIDSELPYYVHQHGNTMLAWHHGHLAKKESLPLIFAAQFPVIWGNTKKRYVHCGHMHHTDIKEHNGITVEQHPTLASRDAYSARGGWLSERQVTAICYSDKFGQVARNTVTPEMLAV